MVHHHGEGAEPAQRSGAGRAPFLLVAQPARESVNQARRCARSARGAGERAPPASGGASPPGPASGSTGGPAGGSGARAGTVRASAPRFATARCDWALGSLSGIAIWETSSGGAEGLLRLLQQLPQGVHIVGRPRPQLGPAQRPRDPKWVSIEYSPR